MKRPYSRGVASTSDDSSSSSSISTRLRSSRHKTKDDDVDVKPIFPPPIDLTVNQDKRTVEPVPFSKLRKEKYFVDKSDLIRDIYMNKTRSKYYCFPRACSKSTVISSLVHWLLYDDATQVERLKCFEGTKIFDLAKDADGCIKDGAIGFNHYILIKVDFATVEVQDQTFEEITTSVTAEFCSFLKLRYSVDDEVLQGFLNLKADYVLFFPTLVDSIKKVLSRTTSDSIDRPVVLIIDNFDAPALRILSQEKSTELALKVMRFFNVMLYDVARLDDQIFTKILLFGTHQPIGINTKSNLKKIPVETYPYGTKEICAKFFFSVDDVKTVLKNNGEDENKVTELSKICGQYNIDDEDYFHPGCIVNYITRRQGGSVSNENPTYWCSLDSLDILSNAGDILPYEMVLWTYKEDQTLDFQYKKVLIYENLQIDRNVAYTYLLEGGYLKRKKASNPPTYEIVNSEARTLFAARFEQWSERIHSTEDSNPFICFKIHNYDGFFNKANEILKTSYAAEDFRYEGQYHVFLASFFHNTPAWYFKSNNQAGYGKHDFVTWSTNPLADTGYVFEIARLTAETNSDLNKKNILAMMKKKKEQVENKEYFLAVEGKNKIKCIVVVGCQKRMSFSIFDVE